MGASACAETGVSATPESCRFTEKDLIAAWSSPIEDSEVTEDDSRELDFEATGDDRVVREYLHHRPMSLGTWTFEACRVLVTFRGGGTEEFRLEGEAIPVLVGNPDDAVYRTVYTKIADASG